MKPKTRCEQVEFFKPICDERLPALKKDYNISPDPEHRGIGGASSGGCAAFAVAWFRPDEFRKIVSIVKDKVERSLHAPPGAAADAKPTSP